VPGLDAPGADLGLVLGERPRQVPVEDVAAGHAELGLELDRRARLDAGRPGGGAPEAGLDRLGQDAVQRAQGGRDGGGLGRVVVAGEEAGRRVEREARQRLGARGAQALAEDGGVGEGVAVGLARDGVGEAAGARPPVRGRELAGGLVDVERAGEGLARVDRRVAAGAGAGRAAC
jgi:hypothetical protein